MFTDPKGEPIPTDFQAVEDEYDEAYHELVQALLVKTDKVKLVNLYVRYRRASDRYKLILSPERWKWVEDKKEDS